MLNFILYLFYNNIIITFAYINLKHIIMGRKKLVNRDEIKVSFTITIEQKWINNQNHDELRRVACDSISKYVEQHGIKNQKNKVIL